MTKGALTMADEQTKLTVAIADALNTSVGALTDCDIEQIRRQIICFEQTVFSYLAHSKFKETPASVLESKLGDAVTAAVRLHLQVEKTLKQRQIEAARQIALLVVGAILSAFR